MAHEEGGSMSTTDDAYLRAAARFGDAHVTPESCEAGLREAGARRKSAARRLADARLELAEQIRAAEAQGVPVYRIARLVGMSRQSVYSMLDGRRRSRASDPAGV
jgi:hypothetical protein